MHARLGATMVKLPSVITSCLLLTAAAASAEEIRRFKVGAWSAGAYTAKGSDEFNHCAATASYRSGISVSFSVGKDFNWSMAFGNPAWRLTRGSAYDIAFTVDDMPPMTAKAFAINSNMVEVPLANSAELFARFRRGYLLRVAGGNQIFSFDLTGTSQLLPTLLLCAQNRGRAPQVAANPFENKATPQSTAPGGSDASAEAITLAANLLSLAGVQGFRLLAPTDAPEIKGDARWIDGNTFGTINVLPTMSGDDLKNLPGYLIAQDAKSCKGAYLSGALPDKDENVLTRVFTNCQASSDKTFTTYYLALPRKAGGAYVISTIAIGSEQPAKEKDSLLRAAVFKLPK